MDERLEKALEFSNYRMTIENQKKNLKLRMETQQTFMHERGTWRADQQLLSFIQTLLTNDIDSSVLQDSRGNPIELSNLKEFQEIAIGKYLSLRKVAIVYCLCNMSSKHRVSGH